MQETDLLHVVYQRLDKARKPTTAANVVAEIVAALDLDNSHEDLSILLTCLLLADFKGTLARALNVASILFAAPSDEHPSRAKVARSVTDIMRGRSGHKTNRRDQLASDLAFGEAEYNRRLLERHGRYDRPENPSKGF